MLFNLLNFSFFIIRWLNRDASEYPYSMSPLIRGNTHIPFTTCLLKIGSPHFNPYRRTFIHLFFSLPFRIYTTSQMNFRCRFRYCRRLIAQLLICIQMKYRFAWYLRLQIDCDLRRNRHIRSQNFITIAKVGEKKL